MGEMPHTGLFSEHLNIAPTVNTVVGQAQVKAKISTALRVSYNPADK